MVVNAAAFSSLSITNIRTNVISAPNGLCYDHLPIQIINDNNVLLQAAEGCNAFPNRVMTLYV